MNRCPVLIAFVSSILLLAAPVSPAQGAVAGLSSNVPEHNIRNAKHLVRFGQSWESMADAWEQEPVPPALTKSMSDDLQALGAPGEVTQAMVALALAAGKPL